MNDPHVVSLEYALETDESLTFDNPPPREGEAAGFTFRLADGVLTLTMEDHYATQEEAVKVVHPFIRGWELDDALLRGRRELRFRFLRSNIVDRKPTPGVLNATLLVREASDTLTVKLTVSRPQYPAPPLGFEASPDVETLWNRYEGHLLGKEPLPAMGYFCLTVLETVFGGPVEGVTHQPGGTRKRTADALNVDVGILQKLGSLTSVRGDAMTARKYAPKVPPLHPLTPQEEEWIRAALRAIIRRIGMIGTGVAIPLLTMADLPKL